jgi:hypothetical protein
MRTLRSFFATTITSRRRRRAPDLPLVADALCVGRNVLGLRRRPRSARRAACRSVLERASLSDERARCAACSVGLVDDCGPLSAGTGWMSCATRCTASQQQREQWPAEAALQVQRRHRRDRCAAGLSKLTDGGAEISRLVWTVKFGLTG